MTHLLAEALAAAARLPEPEQDALARALLADLESEARFDETVESNSEALERLADEALRDYRAGRTEPLHPEHL
jgi:hypothetical protein